MLNFQPHKRKDVLFRVQWLNNPKAIKYVLDGISRITTEEEQNRWFDEYEKKQRLGEKSFFTIFYQNTPIGFMGLSNINRKNKTAEIFILIGDDSFRGRGFGKEALKYLISFAFKELKLEIISLEVNNLNLPAISLYKTLGFLETYKNEKEVTMVLSNK